MPLQSREVITCSLIFDCDAEWDDIHLIDNACPRGRSGIFCLPIEARLQIYRYLLRLDHNRESHVRRVPEGDIDHLLKLDSFHILEAPQFRHKSKQEIDGVLPLIHTSRLHPAILQTCSLLYVEARSILYEENKVIAVQCGISGLHSRLRNYGIPTFGPIASTQLRSARNKPCDGKVAAVQSSRLEAGSFDPTILFKGRNSKTECPYYICSPEDGQDLLHALWILLKSPFARHMRFTVYLSSSAKYHSPSLTDRFIRDNVLPWMHNHVDILTMDDPNDARLVVHHECLTQCRNGLGEDADINVATYNTVCLALEQRKEAADRAIVAGQYRHAETLYERICYEACSMVRTRTAKLVDVSDKTGEGINRICKLIAVSAYHLCELRSGSIKVFRKYRKPPVPTPCASPSSEMSEDQVLARSSSRKQFQHSPPAVRLDKLNMPTKLQSAWRPQAEEDSQTTHLTGVMATEHAIMAGLLALRLPCATPTTEWYIRVYLMLLYLFIQYDDLDEALRCIRNLYKYCSSLLNSAKENKKAGTKWDHLQALVYVLEDQVNLRKRARLRKQDYQKVVELTQDCVRRLWGERLNPKPGYKNLIWTFRWA